MNKRLADRIICYVYSHFICKTNSEEWMSPCLKSDNEMGTLWQKLIERHFRTAALIHFPASANVVRTAMEKKQNLSHFFINQGKYLGWNMLACQSIGRLIMTLRKVVLHTFPKRAFDNLCASPSILRSLLVVFWAFLVFFAGATLGEQLILLSAVLSPTTFSKSSMIVPSDC